jgi:hypothetical protein
MQSPLTQTSTASVSSQSTRDSTAPNSQKSANDIDNRTIFKVFYTQQESAERHTCKLCSKTITQDVKKGYGNTVAHIKAQHKNYVELIKSMTSSDPSQTQQSLLISDKAQYLHDWLELVIEDCQPFHYVESKTVRKFTKISKEISAESLMKIAYHVAEDVEQRIASELPEKFGIIMDGWERGHSPHCVALFACFRDPVRKVESRAVAKTPLLSIAPFEDETNFTAVNAAIYIRSVLEKYGKTEDNVIFIVADNTSVQPATARQLNAEFIGCAR